MTPSTLGENERGSLFGFRVAAVTSVLAGRERMHETLSVLHPRLLAKAVPFAWLVTNVCARPAQGPLSVMPLWNKPAAKGEAI